MKKQITLSLLAFIVCVSLVSASSFIFKLDENVNYRFRCLNENNSYCSNGVLIMISIEYPNGSNALDNRSLTYNPTYFNVTLPTDTLGTGYKAILISPSTNGTVTEFTYDVTYTGNVLSSSQMIIYIIGIVFLVFLILGTVFIISSLPSQDMKNDDNEIMQVSQLKHLRHVLWVVIWFIGIAIAYLVSSLAIAYLQSEMLGNLIFVIFRIMFYISIIGVPVYIMFILYRAVKDKEFQNMISRGLYPETF